MMSSTVSRTQEQGLQPGEQTERMQEHCTYRGTGYSSQYSPTEWRMMNIENIVPEMVVTKIHRLKMKLRMPSGDFKEDRLSTSAQSTPCGTPSGTPSVTPSVSPHASPILNRRSWFNSLSPAPFLTTPELGSPNFSPEMGGNEGGGAGGERWSFFGTSRPVVQKSSTDPGSETNTGFTLQSYFGVPKSNTMEGIKTQVNLMVDDPAKFNPPRSRSAASRARDPPRLAHTNSNPGT
ncbi:putative monooxygenase p33MONOX [Salvelinus namaycush]|uniref:Putative monooxygenase p33MONOX n=1 Tax=Salvelinus namaycush TaxID=8040 RepID=A0A8U1H4H9_SALNM|nr:putative monooxygenase p33MONOX [Salvelinus namaycush]